MPRHELCTAASFLLATTTLLIGCGEPTRLADGQAVVVNLLDIFEFEVTGLDDVTDNETYLWTITGPQATVDVTSGLTSGSARLQLRDPTGAIMYSEFIEDEVDGPTEMGGTGLWQIDVVIAEAKGEFSFSIERAP